MSDPVLRRDGFNDVSLFEAQNALQANIAIFKPDTHPILRNQNIALLGICHSLGKLERSLDLLHNKLQPILREMSEDTIDVQGHLTRPR